ncbi:MAG: L,D-transpeptidase family protein [Sphingobium sp.]|uniref:L,D-transpeptidase family protein n=1 Tax=Sphingobium sp. TaxID=1912891 RepID=UPI0029B88DC6|nr:L,D-transpeptidase family protein [Sphingobium sp.]MDX3909014.1 L,D-transpeptidase family protein [Sphingobium sp.]
MRNRIWLTTVVALAGCNISDGDGTANTTSAISATDRKPLNPQAVMATAYGFADAGPDQAAPNNPVLQTQAVLDSLGFSPKLLDGKAGRDFELALRGFQISRDLPDTGKLDEKTTAALAQWKDRPATRLIRIPEGFAKAAFLPNMPREAKDKAKLPSLAYRDIAEMLAERFHTTPAMLVALNPANGRRDDILRVPNVGEVDLTDAPDNKQWQETLMQLGVSARQPKADRIVVDKSESVLRAYAEDGKLIAQFPATMGSEHDPLPLGDWTIKGVSRNPQFHYNPRLFWDVSDNEDSVTLPAGPNSDVGVVWIDLSKPHYGIHGTPNPELIGRSESHGCIRLTNWDAVRLAQMVGTGVKAHFQN